MNGHANSALQIAAPATVVQAYFDAFGAGNLDGALALLGDDVVWHVDGSVTVPTIGLPARSLKRTFAPLPRRKAAMGGRSTRRCAAAPG